MDHQKFDYIQGQFRSRYTPTKCLDIRAGGHDNGTTIQLWNCTNGNPNQVFDLKPEPIRISAHNKVGYSQQPMCVDVSGGGTANGTNIQLWSCNLSGKNPTQNPNQLFIYSPMDAQIRWATYPNKCVDVAGASTMDGTNIQLWDCLDVDQQKFDYVGGQLRPRHAPAKCLDISRGGRNDGTNIQLWNCNYTNPNQVFDLR